MRSVSGGEGVVDAMLDRIAHRGPDGRGTATVGSATHGHVRLAMVDLSPASSQPFEKARNRQRKVLSYVGEVWNYRELRRSLSAKSTAFSTTGDTEVLYELLASEGVVRGLELVDGMFSFAWSDGDDLWLVTDRYGKVPLHVRVRGNSVEWCSELKGFADPSGSFLLEPGTAALFPACGGPPSTTKWYELPRADPDGFDLIGTLRSSVSNRLQADAPVAVLCSGGLDSTLVTALAAEHGGEVEAYVATCGTESTDYKNAAIACGEFGIKLNRVDVSGLTHESFSRAVIDVETPSKAQVEIAVLCTPLAKAISADGFKACLSGEGADELFGGYGNTCIKASSGGDELWIELRTKLLSKMARGNFVRCNKAFMAAGVECRLPYMDRRIVEHVLSMGKSQCPPGKKLLKAAAGGVIPRKVIARQKETFQGSSGSANAAASLVANPQRFYNAEFRKAYGNLRVSR